MPCQASAHSAQVAHKKAVKIVEKGKNVSDGRDLEPPEHCHRRGTDAGCANDFDAHNLWGRSRHFQVSQRKKVDWAFGINIYIVSVHLSRYEKAWQRHPLRSNLLPD